MTPEQIEAYWTDDLYQILRRIGAHHYMFLPEQARRIVDPADMVSEALVNVLSSARKNTITSQTKFERFCAHAMRKQCLYICRTWNQTKRHAVAVTSIGELEEACGDQWVPATMMAHADDMYPPTAKAEAQWARKQAKQRGLKPLDPTVQCWHCGDPAKRSGASGTTPKTGQPMRLCHDPRCKLARQHEHNQKWYYANHEAQKRRVNQWYHANKAKRAAKLAEARATKN